MGFVALAEGVWIARYDWFDVNVTVVAGERGLLVVDTHASAMAAREVIADVRALGAGEVVEVVNTHEHFDHCFGNGEFRAAYGALPITAHENAAAAMVPAGERIKSLYAAEPDDPHAGEVEATVVVAAEQTFSSARVIDLGDRLVELAHPGRAHTDGDLVVRVPDVDVVLAGDLIEQSAARDGVPGLGPDCFPMDWPASLDVVLGLLTPATLVVPGHGTPVDRGFVEDQRGALAIVAETIRDLATRGVPVEEALSTAEDWPFPRHYLTDAVRRGYWQLPRVRRRLPLI